MSAAALKAGFSPATAAFCFVPPDYYERSLEERAVLLSAPSVDLLCKTIVVENRKWQEAAALYALVPSASACRCPQHADASLSVFFLRGREPGDAETMAARSRYLAVVLQVNTAAFAHNFSWPAF